MKHVIIDMKPNHVSSVSDFTSDKAHPDSMQRVCFLQDLSVVEITLRELKQIKKLEKKLNKVIVIPWGKRSMSPMEE